MAKKAKKPKPNFPPKLVLKGRRVTDWNSTAIPERSYTRPDEEGWRRQDDRRK